LFLQLSIAIVGSGSGKTFSNPTKKVVIQPDPDPQPWITDRYNSKITCTYVPTVLYGYLRYLYGTFNSLPLPIQ